MEMKKRQSNNQSVRNSLLFKALQRSYKSINYRKRMDFQSLTDLYRYLMDRLSDYQRGAENWPFITQINAIIEQLRPNNIGIGWAANPLPLYAYAEVYLRKEIIDHISLIQINAQHLLDGGLLPEGNQIFVAKKLIEILNQIQPLVLIIGENLSDSGDSSADSNESGLN